MILDTYKTQRLRILAENGVFIEFPQVLEIKHFLKVFCPLDLAKRGVKRGHIEPISKKMAVKKLTGYEPEYLQQGKA